MAPNVTVVRLDPVTCRARAATARFAVLATTNASGGVDLVPITFALTGGGSRRDDVDRVLSAIDHKPKSTTRLARLANIASNPAVTLLFEHRDDADWAQLWWVRATGTAQERPPGHGVDALVARYRQYVERPPTGPVLEITVTRWQGWSAS